MPGWPLTTSVASRERADLCDLFDTLGPDAPTLCDGWTTLDLAAHLVARERRPDAGIGLAISRLHPHTERVERKIRDSTPYDVLVGKLRSGPPPPMGLPVVRELSNTHEFFVHHEDVRRPNGHGPRHPDPERDAVLWRLLRLSGRAMFSNAGVGVTLERPDGAQIRVHRGADGVVVRGNVDELFLLGFGRRGATEVTVDGSPSARAAFDTAHVGL
jgi:uncharacterized protein (TIGR03085 family)